MELPEYYNDISLVYFVKTYKNCICVSMETVQDTLPNICNNLKILMNDSTIDNYFVFFQYPDYWVLVAKGIPEDDDDL